MSHEQSETIQAPDGSWINVYGSATPQAGKQLPGTSRYSSVGEAIAAARARSDAHNDLREVGPVYSEPMPQPPRWYMPLHPSSEPPMDDRTREYLRNILLRNLIAPAGETMRPMPRTLPPINTSPRTPLQQIFDTIPSGMTGVRG